LRIGADDYVVKPFNPLEVVARAKAVLRRTSGRDSRQPLRVGPLTIDPGAHMALIEQPDGPMVLELTRTEFRLLAYMAASQNRVFERSELVMRASRRARRLNEPSTVISATSDASLPPPALKACCPVFAGSATGLPIMARSLNSHIVRAYAR